nr:hypothetical protein [Tanacetum cinerariifolium]
MSDASSAVTYTSVYTNSEPWRYYGGDSAKIGHLRVMYTDMIDFSYSQGGPEDDKIDYPADGGDGDDKPSDNDDDDDTSDEDPKEEPFEEDDEEEDEHLAPADSSVVLIVDQVLPAGETEALEAGEPTHAPGSPISIPFSQTRLRRARKTVRPEPPMSASMKACIARHAAIPSPPLLIPSLPLPFPSPLTTSLTDTGAPLGYRAAGIRMRAVLPSTSRRIDIPEADMPPRNKTCPTTEPPMSASMKACIARHAAIPSPPLLIPSLPLPFPSPLTTSLTDTGAPLGYRAAGIRMRALLPSTSRRIDIPEADMPPRNKTCLTTSALAGYGITDTWDEIVDKIMEIALTTLEGVNERVTELDTTVKQRIDEFKIRFKEAQDDRALLRARVNTLFRDRPDHHRISILMDREEMYSRKAWAFSMDRSSVIAAHVRTLEPQVAALIT